MDLMTDKTELLRTARTISLALCDMACITGIVTPPSLAPYDISSIPGHKKPQHKVGVSGPCLVMSLAL